MLFWACKIEQNCKFFRSYITCNESETFPSIYRALSHFSTAETTDLEDHKLLSQDCSRTGGNVGRPRGSKNIKKEPGLEDYDEFDDGRDINNEDDEDYKPELDGHLPLPNAFLDLSNDDIDKELGDQDLDDENDP